MKDWVYLLWSIYVDPDNVQCASTAIILWYHLIYSYKRLVLPVRSVFIIFAFQPGSRYEENEQPPALQSRVPFQ